jgi:hypothetical protein
MQKNENKTKQNRHEPLNLVYSLKPATHKILNLGSIKKLNSESS